MKILWVSADVGVGVVAAVVAHVVAVVARVVEQNVSVPVVGLTWCDVKVQIETGKMM